MDELVEHHDLDKSGPGALWNSLGRSNRLDHFGPFNHPDIPSSRTVTNNGPNPWDL